MKYLGMANGKQYIEAFLLTRIEYGLIDKKNNDTGNQMMGANIHELLCKR